MSASGAAASRYHGFDALRAFAVLFGTVAQAGSMYSSAPAHPVWPVKDTHRSVAADWLLDVSGLFLLPVFFLLAGFFAGRSVATRGRLRFLWHRCLRLAVPLGFGWAVGFPVLRAAFAAATEEAVLLEIGPNAMHLWFLEYLLLYCAAGVILAPLLRPLKVGFQRLLKSGLLPLAGAALTAPVLALSPAANFGAPPAFVPDPVALVAYGAFFAAGWGLYASADRLVWLGRWGCSALLAGVLLAGLISGGGPGTVPRAPAGPAPDGAMPESGFATVHGPLDRLPHAAARTAVAWLLTFGLTGVIFRHLNHESRALRYFSGASFWLYLGHVPVLAWIGLALRPLDWPGDVKLVVAALLCVGTLLVPYELLARLRARVSVPPPAPGAPVRAARAALGGKEALA